MEYAAKFAALAQMNHDLLGYMENLCCLAVTCPYDDETLKSLFWIETNYHHPVDLPDNLGLDSREFIIRCTESAYSWFQISRAQPTTTLDCGDFMSATMSEP